jgi:hypothetical protein
MNEARTIDAFPFVPQTRKAGARLMVCALKENPFVQERTNNGSAIRAPNAQTSSAKYVALCTLRRAFPGKGCSSPVGRRPLPLDGKLHNRVFAGWRRVGKASFGTGWIWELPQRRHQEAGK